MFCWAFFIMKYFIHDTNSRNDEKVTLLFIEFGYEGLGLFYSILEILAAQEKPVAEKVLKSQLKIKKRLEKQLQFMYKIEILSIRNGDVFNENILKFSGKYQIKKEKTREKVSEWRNKQKDIKNVTSYKNIRNNLKDNISKDNISKVNRDCEILINYSFDEFWNAYDKKVGDKTKLEKKWNNLTDDIRTKILFHIEKYKISQPVKKYRKNPEAYLNNKSWEDEIINNNNDGQDTETQQIAAKLANKYLNEEQ